MKGLTYFSKNGFSINEGGTPVNITMLWNYMGVKFFIYVYFFGRRFNRSWTNHDRPTRR